MNELEQEIAALKTGEKEKAHRLLSIATGREPKSIRAWKMFYNASLNNAERINCLEHIVKLEPGNQQARTMLEQLKPSTQKTSKTNLNVLIGIFLFVLAVFFFILVTKPSTTSHEVMYSIDGSATSALITYTNAQGGLEQTERNLPYLKTMKAPSGTSLSLVAANNGDGSIKCEIWIDNVEIKTSISSATYGVVTCAVVIP